MDKKPEIRIYAGPNGSGKSTFTEILGAFGKYVNADEIKIQLGVSDLEAAQIAEKIREESLKARIDFSFETVLSTSRNIELLKKSKEQGYFIKAFYVLTKSPEINIKRVYSRGDKGGHLVPVEKIVSRYRNALKLLPELIDLCDVIHIYDNSDYFTRIYKKRKDNEIYFNNNIWSKKETEDLVKGSALK